MASSQYFEAPYTVPYYPVEDAMGYSDVEGRYETAPEQLQEPYPHYDFIEASSPSSAAAVRQDLTNIEEELWGNYLSELEVAPASASPLLAGPAFELATHEPLPSEVDTSLAHSLGYLNFDYLDEPVYQIGNTRAPYHDTASYENYVAHAFRPYHGAHDFAALPGACVAPEDLHMPSLEYADAHATFAAHHDWRAPRAHDASSSSPSPITRRPPAQTEPLVPGFSSSKRRNVQIAMPAETAATTPIEPRPTARSSMNRWKCPYCEFVQWNRRGPDLRRHKATHTGDINPKKARYLCCGVPLFEAAEHGVPDDFVNEEEPREFEGMFMIGGCRRTFSRKDAYMRHLTNQAGRCFGDAEAPYQPGRGLSASA